MQCQVSLFEEKMTCFVAVCNQKGGVAKTTTSLSLGACLAGMGKAVLLVDLDPQANLTTSVTMRPRSREYTVADAVLGDVSVVEASRSTTVAGLDILPADPALATLDRVLYQRQEYEGYLKEAVSDMDPLRYDYALFDCAPSLGPLTLNALTAADLMIIPTQAESYALRSLKNVFRLIEMVRLKTNPDLRYRILVTMYDRRNGVCVKTLEHMRRTFAEALFDTVIEVDTKLRESTLAAVPITVYSPGTRAAEQYCALAKELVDHE
jgi:chromosome partitioning protein